MYVIPRKLFENLKEIPEFKDISEDDFIVTNGFFKQEEIMNGNHVIKEEAREAIRQQRLKDLDKLLSKLDPFYDDDSEDEI